MKKIPLSKGQTALIDDEDYSLVSSYKWHAGSKSKTTYYARSKVNGRFILMHRLILGAKEGEEVDHRDGNGLDNRRCNLRLATKSQNMANTGVSSRNKSGFKGVSWDRQKSKWVVSIFVDGKYNYLGRFVDKQVAAKAYDAKAKELFGDFAKLNF